MVVLKYIHGWPFCGGFEIVPEKVGAGLRLVGENTLNTSLYLILKRLLLIIKASFSKLWLVLFISGVFFKFHLTVGVEKKTILVS
jgi:hypothetical protein